MRVNDVSAFFLCDLSHETIIFELDPTDLKLLTQ